MSNVMHFHYCMQEEDISKYTNAEYHLCTVLVSLHTIV